MYNNEEQTPGTSCQSEEGGRGCRNKRKQNDPTFCPVCSITLRHSEVDIHLNSELEKLNKLPSSKYKVTNKTSPSSSTNGSSENNPDKNWETYQKIRSNRQSRQKMKTRKRRAEDVCPICNKEVTGDINLHVELCIRKTEVDSDGDENIDVEAFEEYEWAGQSRLRITTLLEGDLSGLGTSISMSDVDDEDLNVDVDDTLVYGSPQYSETDVILPCEDPENVALRKAVTGTDPKKLCIDKNSLLSESNGGDPVIEVLKNRIKELEAKECTKEEVYKCLICMERYKTPVTSVCCWHVHCEQCWLQTLGAKKLCPQCNMITSPTDLRRIYM